MKFAADENFDGRILDGLLERLPDIDIVRVQDTEMVQAPDPDLLEWLASQDRILLTHDIRTMRDFAYARVDVGLKMVGVIIVRRVVSIGQIIHELEIAIGAGTAEDFVDVVAYIPM